MPFNLSISDLPAWSETLMTETSRVIAGASDTIRLLMAAIFCGGHVLLEDLPGTGKTTLVKAVTILTGCEGRRVQCTPDLMPADLTGYEILQQDASGNRHMDFRKGPVFTNMLLVDEINRMTPRSQAGLLECMAERQVTAGGKTYPLPEPFLVVATQNPIELQGTFPLPEAQLDRFFMRLSMGNPTAAQERAILSDRQLTDPLDSLSAVTSPAELLAVQRAVRNVTASDDVLDYLLALVTATRNHPKLRYGLSTRAALALRHAAQALASMDGRSYLLPDDIKAAWIPVCGHRLQASDGLLSDRKAAEAVLLSILSSVEVPKP